MLSAMIVAILGFWGCVLISICTWFVYPLLLWVAGRLAQVGNALADSGEASDFAPVTLLITAHNEESTLNQKLGNSLLLTYPKDKLEIFVASDGSIDGTVQIARHFAKKQSNIFVYEQEERRGKTLTQNAAIERSRGEIIVFTDADTTLNCDFLKQIVMPFANPKVGCVAGRLIWTNPGESAITGGGGLYWRYEHFLWYLESQLGILAWASGACMAVRRDLFKPMKPQYGEDCVVPLDVVAQDYKVVFRPDAIAYEERIADPKAELWSRARMTLRSFTGTLSYKQLLNPFRYPGVAWAIMFHKILRWLTPYFLGVTFISNLFLLSQPFYRLTFVAQLSFYLAGLIGYLADRRRLNIPLVSAVYAFCLANLAMFWGVTKALLGHRIVAYRSEG